MNDSSDPNGPYAVKMIELALKHIDKKYKLVVSKEPYSQVKIMEEVTIGKLEAFWNSSNADKESQFAPIRIPLYKGLLGNRIFIINKNNQSKFDNIQNLEDLKKITIGQGKTWADTKILESNGLKVVKANKYESLFLMVEGGRFDAFSRGVHEPFGELANHPNLKDLTVEKHLMLVYRMPFYLFVAKNNKTLAKDLEDGLNRAIADGSFDQVFFADPAVQDVMAKADMKNRRAIYLDNPTLSKETPLDRKELWFDPKTIP
ncbi:MAG: transporter substrate-binding domain-containing protein [Gammaproteobacteria bacterium]|nr:MAG: transporter substrate-binding domain-containing protein [Gammaproteobacteria bacterium]